TEHLFLIQYTSIAEYHPWSGMPESSVNSCSIASKTGAARNSGRGQFQESFKPFQPYKRSAHFRRFVIPGNISNEVCKPSDRRGERMMISIRGHRHRSVRPTPFL
ncbi:hypothetical protein, partial [Pseudomonas syringae group genomosp. 3]|uniref:hypothetical protein n=1 Tax=Pseudomonas syringae group genomosp. 3 TaxID=251701 RepID=UPI001C3F3460